MNAEARTPLPPRHAALPGQTLTRRGFVGLRGRTSRTATSLLANGEPMLWLAGGGLVVCVVMIVGLLGLVFARGFSTFWPQPLVRIETHDGRISLGEVTRTSDYRPEPGFIEALPPAAAAAARAKLADSDEDELHRRLLRTGNFELTGEHFQWISEYEVAPGGRSEPEWALLLERLAWGRFYGFPSAFLVDGEVAATEPEAVWNEFRRFHAEVRERFERRRELETHDIGRINHRLEEARLELRSVALAHGEDSPVYAAELREYEQVAAQAEEQFAAVGERIDELNRQNARYVLRMQTADGQEKDIQLGDVVRAFPANQLSPVGKAGVYLSRWWEFLSDEPREANSEGGVFPAIFGTVVMTLIMSLLVVPFGVLAALYLREYARAGPMVSAVRISINNLAGVPSIVFGVFGLGFFSYIIGGSIDRAFFEAKLPSPTFGTGGLLWASLTLALLTLPVVIVATEEALAAVPGSMREGSYACGASKWQTIRRIVLPRAMPGIMTGAILAMARGAGEVAPLMLVGAVKLAPELPVDGIFPYVHPERSFMHLGFHIFDLGFQSQNSEAAKPMVFTTTLLLILIIMFLNLAAVWLRTRLRRKFVASQF
ncbi:MAG: phosphate ABC transporter permease PstA [Candidatus Krumholzibacteriia bacterium]